MIQRFYLIFILLVIFLKGNSQIYVNNLNSKDVYESFCGQPLTLKYGNVTGIKVIIDNKTNNIYYVNSNIYKLHFDFCENILHYSYGLGNFNNENYSNQVNRRFLLANINYFRTQDIYVIDISPVDMMSETQIRTCFAKILGSSFCNDKLYFLINSPRLAKMRDSLQNDIPLKTPTDLYGYVNYQAVSKYKNTGVLRLIDSIEPPALPILPNEIIIVKNITNNLPIVAGVITTEFQTPLSHLSILGLNRKIPICAYTHALQSKELLQYVGQEISFSVEADTFYIVKSAIEPTKNNTSHFKLSKDISVKQIIDINNINKKSVFYVGSKAANFGELNKLSKKALFKVPESGFAIPFYFYEMHMQQSKANILIQEVINDTSHNKILLEAKLDSIQTLIKNTPVDISLIHAIELRMKADTVYSKFRFRSSTNAEDIIGFSGAGLYVSKSAELNNPNKTVEKALQEVWASLWSIEAYNEREYFNINQNQISMGILVHRSFDNEAVNGVAITKNIYRNNSFGFLINAQLGENSVVNPKPNVICDQFICYPENANPIFNNKNAIDIITYSNLNNNQLVMTEAEIKNLANQLDIIKEHFVGIAVDPYTYLKIGLDVEFKIDGNKRTLYIKQVRSYND